jgi:hypothetical protein
MKKGDLFIIFNILFPTNLDIKQKKDIIELLKNNEI